LWLDLSLSLSFSLSNRNHLSYEDCLEDKGKIIPELFCAVLFMTVFHNYTHTHEQFLKTSVGLGLGLVFVHLFRFSILCAFSGLA